MFKITELVDSGFEFKSKLGSGKEIRSELINTAKNLGVLRQGIQMHPNSK